MLAKLRVVQSADLAFYTNVIVSWHALVWTTAAEGLAYYAAAVKRVAAFGG